MNMSWFRQSIASLITLSLTVLPPPASALFGVGDVVFDPSNYSQNVLTAARALQSNLNEVKQIANQLQQIEMEVKNLASFPAETWNEVQSDLDQLKQLAQSSKDIGTAMQTLSVQFKQMYPGYQAPTDYEKEYKTWIDNSMNGFSGAIDAANQHSKSLTAEADKTKAILNLSTSAEGQMQALQAGNMLAAQVVERLQELRQLQTIEVQSQNLYMATQIQDQAAEKAALKAWLDSAKNHKPIN
jgi:P-type conjugative transfer protein TrbJ